MSFLGTMEAQMPPGFRFHPRDEELVSDYLAAKVAAGELGGFPAMMIDVDHRKCEPWNLPSEASVGNEWYFYTSPDKKYASGQRTNRATSSGYWKATGKDRPVVDPRRGGLVGTRKTLVFYHGKAPRGTKTDWVMHEFRLQGSAAAASGPPKGDWVLCRIFRRSSRGLSSRATPEDYLREAGPSPSSFPPPAGAFTSGAEQAPLGLQAGQHQAPAASSSGHSLGPQPPRESSFPAAWHVPPGQGRSTAAGYVERRGAPAADTDFDQPSHDRKAILNYLSRLDLHRLTDGCSGGHTGSLPF